MSLNKNFPKMRRSTRDYPYLDNTSTEAPDVEYDYNLWTPGQRLFICSVNWTPTYQNVVEWKNTDKEVYFSSLKGVAVEPVTSSRRVENVVKINLPYNECLEFNYLYTDFFPYPVPGGTSERRLYYFITSAEELAPNTTALYLEPDLWTTYREDIEIDYVNLERGHAPAALMPTNNYFKNPAKNRGALGASEDITPVYDLVSDSDNYDGFQGDKSVVFALPIAPGDISKLLRTTSERGYSEATFSNASFRDGYQWNINGLKYGVTGVPDYSEANIRAEVAPSGTQNNMTPGLYLYTCSASEIYSSESAFETFALSYPGIVAMCEGFFIVPSSILTTAAVGTYGGIELKRVTGSSAPNFTHTLEASDFDIETEYAKVFTWPYCWYSFEAPDGTSIPIKIEEVNGDRITVKNLISLSLPALSWIASITNVGETAGAERIEWKNLKGSSRSVDLPSAGYMKYALELDIPTYELRLSNYVYAALTNNQDAAAAEAAARVNYHNSLRVVNTNRENGLDTSSTMVTNTANAGNTAESNTAIVNAGNTANSNKASEESSYVTASINLLTGAEALLDNALNSALTGQQNEATAAINTNTQMGNITAGLVSGGVQAGIGAAGSIASTMAAGAATGAAAGSVAPGVGTAVGAVAGAVMAGAASGALMPTLNAIPANANTAIMINLETAKAGMVNDRNTAAAQGAQSRSTMGTDSGNRVREFSVATGNSVASRTTSNNVALANNQAANNKTRSDANSTYSRDASVKNAQDTLNLGVRNYSRSVLSGLTRRPATFGTDTGNTRPDAFGFNGYSIKSHTCDKETLEALLWTFKRYGYRYGRGFKVADNLAPVDRSYIECSEVLNYSGALPNFAREAIFSILMEGTTVWNNPDNIGGGY